jgi:VIT1/CCC1 family predicted Fe2+/Mn2+ transporter
MTLRTNNYVSSKLTKYLPEFVYGSIDGTVTTFAIIAGIAGAQLDTSIVIILGFSNVLADGFSMASSNYLSEQSHNDQTGITSEQSPLKTALATFLSFISIGSIPVVSYIFAQWIPYFSQEPFYFAMLCTGITFIGIGFVRGFVSNKNPLRTSLETFTIGTIAAGVAYIVGFFLEKII